MSGKVTAEMSVLVSFEGDERESFWRRLFRRRRSDEEVHGRYRAARNAAQDCAARHGCRRVYYVGPSANSRWHIFIAVPKE